MNKLDKYTELFNEWDAAEDLSAIKQVNINKIGAPFELDSAVNMNVRWVFNKQFFNTDIEITKEVNNYADLRDFIVSEVLYFNKEHSTQ